MAEWLLTFVVLLFSLVWHEAAHAWMALRRGDPTAYFAGRLTLNPLAHLDPLGSVLLPLIGILTGAPVIGWAKPVPVNPSALRTKRDSAWVAAAGPGSNLVLAGACLLLFAFVQRAMPGSLRPSLTALLVRGVLINTLLAAFNLLPVPPLDGSWIASQVFPRRVERVMDRLRPYGSLILVGLLASGVLRWVLFPAFLVARVLLGLAGGS